MTASIEYRMVTTWRRAEDIALEKEKKHREKNPLFVRTFEAGDKLWFVSGEITRHFLDTVEITEKWNVVKEHMMMIHTSTAGHSLERVVDLEGLLVMIDFEDDERREKLREFVLNVSANNSVNVARPKLVRVYMTDEEKAVFI